MLRFDHAGGTPSLAELYRIGRGDLVAGSVFGDTGPRMDFATIALLPDGRFAVAYDDTTTKVAARYAPGWRSSSNARVHSRRASTCGQLSVTPLA